MAAASQFDLQGRVIIVTGGAKGLGEVYSRHLCALGARVVVADIDPAATAALAAELVAAGGEAIGVATDVTDAAAARRMAEAAVAAWSRIDALVNNAALMSVLPRRAWHQIEEDEWDRVMAVNLKGVFWAIQHVLPAMKERGAGSILVTGSLASERGLPMNAGYVASKHAVLGLSRAVANEAAEFGVRCNCIVPGLIETPMLDGLPPEAASQMAKAVPQGRTGQPEELANVAAFLLSDAASHVTAQSWAVDGGMLGTMRV